MGRCTQYTIYVIKFARLPTGQWFFLGAPVSSTNKTDSQDITEILLKVALNTINQIKPNMQTIHQISCCKLFKYYISAEHTTLRSKYKDWLARNHCKVYEEVTWGRSVIFSWYSSFLHQKNLTATI